MTLSFSFIKYGRSRRTICFVCMLCLMGVEHSYAQIPIPSPEVSALLATGNKISLAAKAIQAKLLALEKTRQVASKATSWIRDLKSLTRLIHVAKTTVCGADKYAELLRRLGRYRQEKNRPSHALGNCLANVRTDLILNRAQQTEDLLNVLLMPFSMDRARRIGLLNDAIETYEEMSKLLETDIGRIQEALHGLRREVAVTEAEEQLVPRSAIDIDVFEVLAKEGDSKGGGVAKGGYSFLSSHRTSPTISSIETLLQRLLSILLAVGTFGVIYAFMRHNTNRGAIVGSLLGWMIAYFIYLLWVF